MRTLQCTVWVLRKQGCPCRGARTAVLPHGHTRGLCFLPRPDLREHYLPSNRSYYYLSLPTRGLWEKLLTFLSICSLG